MKTLGGSSLILLFTFCEIVANAEAWTSPVNATCGFQEGEYPDQRNDTELAKICEKQARAGAQDALLVCCLTNRFRDRLQFRPVNKYADPIQILVGYNPEELVGINDIDQTIQVRGKLGIIWTNKLIKWKNVTTYRKYNQADDVSLSTSQFGIWYPRILHKNNAANVHAINDLAKRQDELKINFGGTPQVIIIGVYESRCLLRLENFPFDRQQCDFELQLPNKISLVSFNAKGMGEFKWSLGNKLLSSSLWREVGNSYGISALENGEEVYRYTMEVERRYLYYLITIIAPSVCSAILQMTVFWIPFYSPDRPNYAVVITLTFAVLQLTVKNLIPKTSRPVILVLYLLALMALGTGITVHSVLLYWSYDGGSKELDPRCVVHKAKQRGRINPFVIDGIAFVIVFLATCGIHFFLIGIAWFKVVTIF